MLFIPITILAFIAFVLFLPLLFILGYFQIIIVGFEKLGISSGHTLFLLFLILIGSAINIPLTKKKIVLVQKRYFFGLLSRPRLEANYLAINVGGAVIPFFLSLYFLFLAKIKGFDLNPIFITIILMTIISKVFSRVVPGKGIVLPTLIPPLFSALFSLILVPEFKAPAAFISGVLGTLIGADILNLKKVRNFGGYLSIGGAGVFDGIFLVGIVSSLLSGF